MQQAQQKPLPIYLRYPRCVAYTGLALFAFITGLVNVASNIALLHHLHSAYLPWEPYVWEHSSTIVVLVAVPLIVAFDRRLPIGWNTWRINILRHAIATVVFSAYFSAGSIAFRKLAYAAFGSHYDINMVPIGFGYDYLPHAQTYLEILGAPTPIDSFVSSSGVKRGNLRSPKWAHPLNHWSDHSVSWCASSARNSWWPSMTLNAWKRREIT